ncbi:histidine kinase [Streptomyces sp. NPDC046716]|uniref:sensor histidine kinase n=1 Tax=Streptomyces sp. NPDC046716 TaxID=3157093 RepID=UPI0033E31968
MRARQWWARHRRIPGWHNRSDIAQIELYTRLTLYVVVWLMLLSQIALSLTEPVRAAAPTALIVAACVLGLAQGFWNTRLAARGLDVYLGRVAVDRNAFVIGAVLMVAATGTVLALATFLAPGDFPMFVLALGSALLPYFGALSLVTARRRTAVLGALALTVATGVGLGLSGHRRLIGIAVFGVLFGGLWGVCTMRPSGWTLKGMWDLHEARETKALLAVAEERLRFGRDLHDVMGRNLSVVALKSELAVQLARRGRTEAAVAQMVEVQRIARESQKEVRDVVRGYRETDLTVELAGAQGVLDAAGITCTVTGSAAGLSDEVQAALGWVVREATTNVLRHGDAKTCRVELETGAEDVVLTVENDGAGDGTNPGSGSGLAGLRERLAFLDGELTAGPVRKGLFRVRARVPLPGVGRSMSGAGRSRPGAGLEGAPGTEGGAVDAGVESAPETGRGPAGAERERVSDAGRGAMDAGLESALETGRGPAGAERESAPETGRSPAGAERESAPETGRSPAEAEQKRVSETGRGAMDAGLESAPETGRSPAVAEQKGAPGVGRGPAGVEREGGR